ncbi:MAG: WYL domain-containing protein [Zoogloea sp.]|uniref:helix-turn-helix transcriptional regulator n=1 Tax=Zoogloea sp. TaxID=49181 RepID=UPI002618CEAC|nr:WYL domain-containing protein [Zoogloea sp.]MDD2990365.1 WYL domain-containing protein [Zoogloea sp.]
MPSAPGSALRGGHTGNTYLATVQKEVSRKRKTARLIHSRTNDARLSPLVKIQPVHLVSFKPVRTKESTRRVISPQQLVHYRENWILDAWCHSKNALRSFALDAIQSIRVLDELAIEVSPKEMQEHFRSGYGIFAGAAAHRARLKFTSDRAQWVGKETWHHDQTSSYLDDGSYMLEVPYSNDQELIMDLLRHSPEVEVLGPPELRRKLHVLLCAAATRNSLPEGY